MTNARERTKGVLAGATSYLIWGIIAGYFRILGERGVAPMPLLAHRIIWSMVFCVAMLLLLRNHRDFRQILFARRGNRKRLLMLTLSSLMLTVNWLTFIYSIEQRRLNESALGYFIVPLISLLLGLIVLREKLRPMQWVAVGLAAVGVAIIVQGSVPWIALPISLSFGIYGLIRKTTPVSAMTGLAVETAILTPAALIYVAVTWQTYAPITFNPTTYGLLMLSGIITAVPLLLFAYAARTLRLSTIGFLQYLAPTIQLLLSTLIYGEPLHTTMLIGFIPIWLGLALFSTDVALASRRAREGS